MHWQDRIVVASQKLFFEDFDGLERAVSKGPAKIDLGGVALAERLDNLVRSIERGVFGSAALDFLMHFQ